MLSPRGKSAFATWAKSDLNIPKNLEAITISPQLEAEFNSEDEQVALSASVTIAKIGGYRLSAYFDSIEGGGERFREAPSKIQRWYANNKAGHQYVESDVIQRLNAMVKDGKPESIIKWAKTLQGLLTRTQFEINPIRVRSEGEYYGTVGVNKRKILRALQKYSVVLESLCAPIYEELERLSQFINGYYMQNRTGDAFKAADSAERLEVHTKELARSAED